MFEFQCEYCGKTRRVLRRHDIGKFCSMKCYHESVNKKNNKYNMVYELECIFQPESVMCNERNCDKCGWNPVVARARLAAMGVKDYEPYTV